MGSIPKRRQESFINKDDHQFTRLSESPKKLSFFISQQQTKEVKC